MCETFPYTLRRLVTIRYIAVYNTAIKTTVVTVSSVPHRKPCYVAKE
jgi:hypothetical protein